MIFHECESKTPSASGEGRIRSGVRLGIQITGEADLSVKQDERFRFIDSPGGDGRKEIRDVLEEREAVVIDRFAAFSRNVQIRTAGS